ncbi:MAG TPA: cytochrome c oxidase subunit 3 [Actinomycetota bacterium]|nr:cytochrome c oxidase subunit 3 [Actinomycetota bacterium]
MSVAAHAPRSLRAEPSRGRSPGFWGMWMLIFTEATLFSILLTSYFFLRFRAPEWPLGDIPPPELALVFVMTPILLLSSAPMHWADVAARRGWTGQLKAGLLLTFLMGATFLGLQGYEYMHTLREFTPRTNVYGTLFFTITGFHGLHVLVGLVMVLWVQFYAWRGAFGRHRQGPVEVVALYWHFVDVVWLAILVSVYLSPHFWPQ